MNINHDGTFESLLLSFIIIIILLLHYYYCLQYIFVYLKCLSIILSQFCLNYVKILIFFNIIINLCTLIYAYITMKRYYYRQNVFYTQHNQSPWRIGYVIG